MTEESLVLGRPPRPPRGGRRTGRWGGRGPRVVATAAVVALTGWAAWQGLLDSPATPHRQATPSPVLPSPSLSDPSVPPTTTLVRRPPAVPYLRSGVLILPGDLPRVVPDGEWNDLAELADGRIVLVQRASVTVVGPARPPRHYPLSGGITARSDGTAVAWTWPDGRVRRLGAGDVEPVVVPGARQLVPTCHGLRVDGRLRPGWRTCDRDGGLLGPGGGYFASIGPDSVTLAPRADITGGISFEVLGTVLDAVWEDAFNVLVAVETDGMGHLMRVGLSGESEELVAPVFGGGRGHPALVLPVINGPVPGTMQP